MYQSFRAKFGINKVNERHRVPSEMEFHEMLAWKWARGQIRSEGEWQWNECNKLLFYMYNLRSHLAPKLCLLILFVTCSMIPYHFVAVCCLLLLPHLRWLIDKYGIFYESHISPCQDMNRLEAENWINAQRKSIGTMNKANARKKWTRRRRSRRRRQRTFRKNNLYTGK